MSDRMLRLPEVIARVGLKRSAIYKRVQEKRFPQPIRDGGAAMWPESEIEAYNARRKDARSGHSN